MIETANLLLVHPGLVLHGCLKTKIYVEKVRSFTFLKRINHLLTERPYFQAKIFHEPLVSQEVARHVGVAIIDQRSEAHRQQLQIHILHGGVQSAVVNAHVVTANKPGGVNCERPLKLLQLPVGKLTIVRLFMGSFSLCYKRADTFI